LFELLSTFPVETMPLLLLGLGLGLLHSLDADHIMAVSLFNNQRPSLKRTLFFALYWALGHGGILLCGGLLLFGLGVSIPDSFSWAAEIGVALLLVGLGVYFIWQLRNQHLRIEQHRHGDIVHTHLYVGDSHTDGQKNNHQQYHDEKNSVPKDKATYVASHPPVMVGLLHGLAGSAPALALIPAVASGQLVIAMSYLLLFSFGVIVSMLVFGLGFTYVQTFFYQRYQTLFQWLRGVLAVTAIAVGSMLLLRLV
jgi:ABC-type nickel/cobalt efflux system permease component RcnA